MPRRPRNLRPDLNGLLIIDKPAGVSSFAVCREIRRRSGGAKVGHAGTLDPFATGVLVLALGAATRSIPSLMATQKRYTATLDLARFSTTDDPEGEITPAPGASPPQRTDLRSALDRLTGTIEQRPPIFSAIHIDGRRAYQLARRGQLTERPPARTVTVHSIEIVSCDWPSLTLDVRCGKGVYIRSLARDLGESLGIGGMLTALRRTAVGAHRIEDAQALADVPKDPASVLLPTPTHEPAQIAPSDQGSSIQ